MNRKIISILLSLILCITVFASCTPNEPSDAQTTASGTDAPDTTAGEDSEDDVLVKTVNAYVADLASEYNFDGETFVYVDGDGPLADEEEETGELVNDAFYYRLREIEEKFGVDFRNYHVEVTSGSETGEEKADALIMEVMAGGDAYDLMWGSQVNSVKSMIVNNCTYDINKLSQIDITREWWAPNIEDLFSIGDTIYMLTGPLVKDFYLDGACILFDKIVAENYSVDQNNLYTLARDGKWTFDEMTEIASVVPTNNGGNAAYRYLNPNGLGFYYAAGMTVLKFDEQHIPYVEETLSRELSDLADKVSAVMGDETQAAEYNNFKYPGRSWEELYGYEDAIEMFADDRALFMCSDTATAAALREYDVEFGILPMPKYYDNQADYGTYCGEMCVIVPKSISNPDKVGTIVEATAALSIKYIKPALYEKLLKGRTVYDVESRDMIDIITRTKVYEMIHTFAMGDANQMGTVMKMIDQCVECDAQNLASSYKINAKMCNQTIKNILKGIGKK